MGVVQTKVSLLMPGPEGRGNLSSDDDVDTRTDGVQGAHPDGEAEPSSCGVTFIERVLH